MNFLNCNKKNFNNFLKQQLFINKIFLANIEVDNLSSPTVHSTNTNPLFINNNNLRATNVSPNSVSSMDQVLDVVTPIYSPTISYLSQQQQFMPYQQQQSKPAPNPPSKVTREHLEFMKQQIRNMDVAIQDELDKSPDSCYDYQPSGDFVEVSCAILSKIINFAF